MAIDKNFEVSNLNYNKDETKGYKIVTEGSTKKFNVPTNLPDECIFMYAGKELAMNYNLPDSSTDELETYEYTKEQINNKIEELKTSILGNVCRSIQTNTANPEVRNDDAIVVNFKS